jgi:hypothetical protein
MELSGMKRLHLDRQRLSHGFCEPLEPIFRVPGVRNGRPWGSGNTRLMKLSAGNYPGL